MLEYINSWHIIGKQIVTEGNRKRTKLVCVCKCGNKRLINKTHLLQNKASKCLQCHNKDQLQDIVGKKFNKWFVEEYIGKKKYKCRCECGVVKELFRGSFVYGDSKGCRRCNNRKTYCGDLSMNRFYKIKRSAEIRDIIFNINVEYIWKLFLKQNRKCALTGMEIHFADTCREDKYDVTASLDRIDNTKGYIENDVQWLHKDINLMKQKFTQENFIQYCNMISKQHPREL